MTISLAIDILIAFICLIIIIRNAARGFIKSFMTFAKTILAFLVAYIFNSPLAKLLSEKIFLNLSNKWVLDAFVSTADGEGGYALYNLFDGIPQWFTNFMMKSGIDDSAIQKYFVGKESASYEVMQDLAAGLGAALSSLISTVVSCLVLFIVTEILLIFVGILLGKVGKLPVLRFVNLALGALIGVAVSAVIAWLVSLGVGYIIQFGARYKPEIFNSSIIENSVILKFFSEHNLWYMLKGWLGK
ncbi:MAG: CvpA family protein [Eubacteriales bacterium]